MARSRPIRRSIHPWPDPTHDGRWSWCRRSPRYELGDYDLICSKCGASNPQSTVSATTSHAAQAVTAMSPASQRMLERYTDGYRVARALVGIGATLKAVGIIGAALIVLILVLA